MNVFIEKGSAHGQATAPPSKSMAHRLLICGGLADGESIIHGVSLSEDIKATLNCLNTLGASYTYSSDGTVHITGTGFRIPEELDFNCLESGSTLRFFIPIALLTDKKSSFLGTEKLLSRPLGIYETLCREQHIFYEHTPCSLTVKGSLKSGEYSVPGNISSQFISGLLFALPLLKDDSVIYLLPPVESRAYIDLTIQALQEFGVNISWGAPDTLLIKGSQTYKARKRTVEGDYSNAAFLEVFNCFGGNVTVNGLSEKSLQGDRIYRRMFEKICTSSPSLDLSGCPDLAPILFTLAAAKNGAVFTGTKRLKIKESDRAEVMKEELSKFGADIEVLEDSVIIKHVPLHKPNAVLYGHNDHRVVMSLSVLLTLFGGEIRGAEAVKKSFPDFFEKLASLNINVTEKEETIL